MVIPVSLTAQNPVIVYSNSIRAGEKNSFGYIWSIRYFWAQIGACQLTLVVHNPLKILATGFSLSVKCIFKLIFKK